MIKDKSDLNILASSRLAISVVKKSFENILSLLMVFCLAFLRKCKSSVSSILRELGEYFSTRQPNCSSEINLSNKTKDGFNFSIKLSKLESFNLIETISIPKFSSGYE